MTVSTINKLGLTDDERVCFYYNQNNKRCVGEVRRFDPIDGLLVLYNPPDDLSIEFLWNSTLGKWVGFGESTGYSVEFNIEGETPIIKVDAADRGAQTDGYPEPAEKATTITRFPS